jgi:hypothetical protein
MRDRKAVPGVGVGADGVVPGGPCRPSAEARPVDRDRCGIEPALRTMRCRSHVCGLFADDRAS